MCLKNIAISCLSMIAEKVTYTFFKNLATICIVHKILGNVHVQLKQSEHIAWYDANK